MKYGVDGMVTIELYKIILNTYLLFQYPRADRLSVRGRGYKNKAAWQLPQQTLSVTAMWLFCQFRICDKLKFAKERNQQRHR